MAIPNSQPTDKATLKNWFKTGLIPIQEQFWAWMDSFWHKGESIPQSSIEGLAQTLIDIQDNAGVNIDAHLTDADAHAALFDAKISTSEKGQPLGVSTLGADGKVLPEQMPAIAITESFVVANQAAMLALDVQIGDVAIRQDLRRNFILKATPASVLANWNELLAPLGEVVSVNGQSGVVILDTSQVEPTAARTYITNSEKTTPIEDADGIPVITASGVKFRKWLDILITLSGLFQTKETEIEVEASTNVLAAWNGKKVYFKTSCTVTIPATLPAGLGFNFIVEEGVTVTWAITAPFVYALQNPQKPLIGSRFLAYGNFTRKMNTNKIYIGY